MRSLVEVVLLKRAEEQMGGYPQCVLCGVFMSKSQFDRCQNCRRKLGAESKRKEYQRLSNARRRMVSARKRNEGGR